jgi:hypothetical protein
MHVKITRKFLAIPAAAIAVAGLAACSHSGTTSGQALENKDSSNIEQTYLLNQPPPHFTHSDIRATAISIEAIQALGEQTTSFGFNQGDKDPIWSCPSLGEPVASTTELTNPQQTVSGGSSRGYGLTTLGNMDPNGIYSGDSTGTYVLCVNAQGTPYAQYWEGFVDSVSGPATWDAATGQIVVSGQPTMPKCTVTGVNTSAAKTTCTK